MTHMFEGACQFRGNRSIRLSSTALALFVAVVHRTIRLGHVGVADLELQDDEVIIAGSRAGPRGRTR